MKGGHFLLGDDELVDGDVDLHPTEEDVEEEEQVLDGGLGDHVLVRPLTGSVQHPALLEEVAEGKGVRLVGVQVGDEVEKFLDILNHKGYQNHIICLKVMVSLLNWWILPISGGASGRICVQRGPHDLIHTVQFQCLLS